MSLWHALDGIYSHCAKKQTTHCLKLNIFIFDNLLKTSSKTSKVNKKTENYAKVQGQKQTKFCMSSVNKK